MMTSTETFVAISILALAGWAFYSMRRATRRDADWRAALKDFAKAKGLAEAVAEKTSVEFDSNTPITWKMIRNAWSRNPAMAAPIKGSVVLKGDNNGFPFVMDEVWIRKYWMNLRDDYLRMAVELPGLPATLAISPTGGIGRLARGVGPAPPSSSRDRSTGLAIRFSATASAGAEERGYLASHRVRLLQEFEDAWGGVYVYAGRLFVIRRRNARRRIDLNALYDALGTCARMLGQ